MDSNSPTKIRVGVLRGGVSPEYDVSLASGANVFAALSQDLSHKYKPVDMLVTRDGKWHIGGVPATRESIRDQVDIIWNALHGGIGEDGTVSSFMHHDLEIPFTGSRAYASALAMEKPLAKQKLKSFGIKMPLHYQIDLYDRNIHGPLKLYAVEKAKEVFRMCPAPWVIKPVSGGSSLGIRVAKTLPELAQMIEQAVTGDEEVMVEQWIFGREATGAVIENFRNKELYPLLPIEIQKSPNDVFDYESKYNGTTREVIGGSLTENEKRKIEELSALVHKELGLRHYSRSDFIITPRGEVYFIEVNSLPGLTSESLVPKALSAVGMSFPNFVDHVLELVMNEQ